MSRAAAAMCPVVRPKCSSRNAVLPVGANERGTPRIRSRAGWCCAVSEATAAPRPPVVVASSAVTIPAVWAAAARMAPVSSGSTNVMFRTRAPMPSCRSSVGRVQGPRDHRPRGDDGDVVPVRQLDGLAGPEGRAGRRDVGHREPGDAQVARTRVGRGPADRGDRLDGVGRHDHREVGDGAQPGQVFDRVMRRAELAVGHTGALPAQHHVRLAVGDVGLDLLEGPAGQEGRGRADEGDQAAVGQPGARRRPGPARRSRH